MAHASPILSSFTSGELTPRLAGRVGTDIYNQGCKKLENMLVWTQGGATKRQGTRFINQAYDSANQVRLLAFEYSFGNAYVLEIGQYYIRFYTESGQILKNGQPVEVFTPYLGTDVFDIKIVQSADTMYLVHQDYAPYKLTRADNDEWAIYPVENVWGPFYDENTDASIVMTPSAAIGEITITQTLERIVNGDFTTTSGWTLYAHPDGGTAQITGGEARLGGGAAATAESYIEQDIATDPGYTHRIDFTVGDYAVDLIIRDEDFTITHYNAASTVGVNAVEFTPTDRVTNVRFYKKGNPSLVSTIDDVSCIKEDDAFNDGKIGAQYKFTGTVTRQNTLAADEDATGIVQMNSGDVVVFSINGTWVGKIWLQRSYDDGNTWVDYEYYEQNASKQYTEYNSNILYRGYVKSGEWTSGSAQVDLSKLEQSGYVEVTGFTSETEVDALVIEPLPETTVSGVAQGAGTIRWSEGAWSTHRGFPGAISFFEGRLLYGGTIYRPQTVWGSVVDDYENFEAGTNANEAYTYTLVSSSINDIKWMLDGDVLFIGTVSSEWKFGLADTATTPTNVYTKLQTTYGTNGVQAIGIGHSVLFIQRGGTKLRRLTYDDNVKGWNCVDISLVAEHLFKDGIVDMAYADNPDNTLWLVTGAGDIVTCLYDEALGIQAFQKQTTTGEFESVSVIPGADRDEVWVVVKRLINGEYRRYIEQFATTNWDTAYTYVIPDTPLEPIFSSPTGTYGANQTVTIWCPTTDVDIFYTTDGTDPTPDNGTLYEEPFLVEVTTQIKARAYLKE